MTNMLVTCVFGSEMKLEPNKVLPIENNGIMHKVHTTLPCAKHLQWPPRGQHHLELLLQLPLRVLPHRNK